MRHKTLLVWAFCLLCSPALADEDNENNGLRANFRRVALEMSSTSVSHAEQYQNSPSSVQTAKPCSKAYLTSFSNMNSRIINGTIPFIWNTAKPDSKKPTAQPPPPNTPIKSF